MRNPFVSIATVFGCSVLAMASAAHAQSPGPGQQETTQERKNVAVVREFWREVHQEFHGDVAPKYLADDYVEHNNGGINGSARMAQFFGHAPPAMRRMKTVSQTVYAGGPFVLLHQHRVVPDASHPGQTVDTDMVEMVRVYDGLLQEHWMYFPAGHTPAMQPQTEQEYKNIAVVTGFWHEIWEGRNGNAVPEYVASGYIEHGASEANGRAAMVQRFGHPLPAGTARETLDSQTVYARGPFVLLHQERVVPDPSQPGKTRNVDLIEMFQVYNGLLQQHWTFFPVQAGTAASWGE
jgi:predicted SnoaL-like aldol condensation-catalyzing enzyme